MADRLEDTSDVLYSGSATDKAIMSIAISLKRIADSLEPPKITGDDLGIVKIELTPKQIEAIEELSRQGKL